MKGVIKFLHFAFGGGVPVARQKAIFCKHKNIVNLVTDILCNILCQNVVPFSPKPINKLKTYKKNIYKLVDKKTSDKTRSKILIKHPQIIKAILPLLSSMDKNLQNEPLYKNVPYKRK